MGNREYPSLLFSGADVIEPSVDMTSHENHFGDEVGLKMAYMTHKHLFSLVLTLLEKRGFPLLSMDYTRNIFEDTLFSENIPECFIIYIIHLNLKMCLPFNFT